MKANVTTWTTNYTNARATWAATHPFDLTNFQRECDALQKMELAKPGTSDSWNPIANLPPNLLLRSKYMKYDTTPVLTDFPNGYPAAGTPTYKATIDIAGVPAAMRSNCLTTFYAPYVYGALRPTDPRAYALGKIDEIDGIERVFFATNPNNQPYDEVAVPTTNTLSINVGVLYTAPIPTPKFDPIANEFVDDLATRNTTYTKWWHFIYVAKLLAHPSHYLGAELFYNDAPAAAFATFATPIALMGNVTDLNSPRMYIVAGNQVVVGNSALAASDTVVDQVLADKLAALTPKPSSVNTGGEGSSGSGGTGDSGSGADGNESSQSGDASMGGGKLSSGTDDGSSPLHTMLHSEMAVGRSKDTGTASTTSTTSLGTASSSLTTGQAASLPRSENIGLTAPGDTDSSSLSHPSLSPSHSTTITSHRPLPRAVNSAPTITGHAYTEFRNDPVPLNSCSIVIIIVTKISTTELRVMHYTAGDALFDVEIAVANWLALGGPATVRACAMKVSQ
jgi:hypothetical protein